LIERTVVVRVKQACGAEFGEHIVGHRLDGSLRQCAIVSGLDDVRLGSGRPPTAYGG
jgi:hypothetical protein